ncbi:hypothetical protein B0H13DRAFT_1854054 [Mycena leptocephala]|nr:hypothetical protein B0H13DRAFT_1854054 [Mycena leptocephala]
MALPTFEFSTTADDAATALASEIAGKNDCASDCQACQLGHNHRLRHGEVFPIQMRDDQANHRCGRLRKSEETIKKELPSANIRLLVLDLSSVKSMRKAAAEVNTYTEPLHVLIHNAAGLLGPFSLTDEGLERQSAIAHFGPFLFTKLVASKLLASTTPQFIPRAIDVSSAVPQSKAASTLAALELARRAKKKISSYSLSPGRCLSNDDKYDAERGKNSRIEGCILKPDGAPNTELTPWKTIPQGAATTVVAAFDPRLNGKSGAYLMDYGNRDWTASVMRHGCSAGVIGDGV